MNHKAMLATKYSKDNIFHSYTTFNSLITLSLIVIMILPTSNKNLLQWRICVVYEQMLLMVPEGGSWYHKIPKNNTIKQKNIKT